MSGLRNFSSGGAQPERNDPCPCGSGLKYKKCCAIRPRSGQAGQTGAALGALTTQGREVAGNAAVNWAVRRPPPQAPAAATPAKPAAAARPAPQVSALINRAQRLRVAGRSDEAIPLLQQAVLLDPANATARHELGSCLLDRGELSEAANHLATAVRLEPNRALSHFHLGLVLSRQGKAAEAIAAHRAAVALAPRLADAHYELGVLHY